MSREKIQTLISSDTDENKIASKLIKYFTQNPGLLTERYVLDRNIFHLLTLKNKAQVLRLLLEHAHKQEESWLLTAILPDRLGSTVLHHAARSELNSTETMKILLHYFSDLINHQNKTGQTPLHEAISVQNIGATEQLVSKQCDRSIKNANDQTVLEMPELNDELKQILLSIDLSTIKSLDLRHRGKSSGESVDSFRDAFPMLASAHLSSSSSSLESPHTALRYQDLSSSAGTSSCDLSMDTEKEQDEIQSISNETVILKLKLLLKAYRTNKRSIISTSLLNDFIALLHKQALASDFDLSKEPELHAPECKQVLLDVTEALYPKVDELYAQTQNEHYKLIDRFIHMLIPHISIADSQPRIPPQFSSDDEQKNNALETLWHMAACQTSSKSKRIFDVGVITNRALNLLSFLSLSEILKHLTDVYRFTFDRDQKIVANFIVLQLLYYNAINHVIPKTSIDQAQLDAFCDLNKHSRYGLGAKLGDSINHYLYTIHRLSNNQLLLHNIYILNQQINCQELITFNKLFDQAVDRALAKTRDERIDEVLLIAHELRMLTLRFYQNVSIEEFLNNNWTKRDKKTLSPNIVEFTEFFNKLSDYFIAKIVSQPPGKVKNALQLCIEIARALCPLKDELYPDINHLMVIGNGVLNSTVISRLASFFEELPPQDKSYLEEITQIVSSAKNFKVMRDLYREYRTTLPYLGLLSRDVTFAIEGNENNIIRAEACGEILRKIMEIKLLVNVERTNFQTDLPAFLQNYTMSPEDHLYNASRRLQPIKSDVINWNNTTEGMNTNIDKLISNYLSIDILPIFLVKKKNCSPSRIPSVLVKSIATRTKELKKEAEKSQVRTMDPIAQETLGLLHLIDKVKNVITEICRINNTYYQFNSSKSKKSAESYQIKLFKLSTTLESIKIPAPIDIDEPDEQEIVPRSNPSRRRTTSLLGRYGIYKEKETSDPIYAASSSTSFEMRTE